MTEAAASPTRSPEVLEFVQRWAESFGHVLGQIAGTATTCVALDEPPEGIPPAAEGDVWVLGVCSGAVRGELALRLNSASGLRLAQTFMSEPAAPDAQLTADHREAVVELLRQVAGIVSSAIKPRWGEVQLRLDASPGAASWPASSIFWLRLGENAGTVFTELHLSAALAAALRAEGSARAAEAPASATTTAPAPAVSPKDEKLALLMEVELAMTLRFGSRRMLLREILELAPGAVVELDRQVEEPVDLLLDGRLVARGEVVVIDGNYGLRVTEIASVRAL